MNSCSKNVATLTALLSIFSSCLSVAQAGWIKVQEHPIRIYRDTRTGLEWSVTIANAGNSNANARNIVQQYGLRLPTWDEFRDVIKNNNAINMLEMEKGLLDLYETDDPNVLVGAFERNVKTIRPWQKFARTWVLGVRDPSGNSQPPAHPNPGGGFRPGQIINPVRGDRIVNVNGIAIRNEAHFRDVIRNADTRIVFTLIDQRSGKALRLTTDLWSKGSITRLGIYVQDDSRGGVMVTRIMEGTPGMNCRYVGIGNDNTPIQQHPPIQQQRVGKLYVLTVWGTNAEDLVESGKYFQFMFKVNMDGAGMGPCGTRFWENENIDIPVDPVTNQRMYEVNFLVEYNELSGTNASNANVLRKCREISQKAQKNDVIFVYISCHGKTMNLYGDNKRYHVLFPGIVRLHEMNKAENGITRSAIIKALNPDDHRLTVLITDTCTRRYDYYVDKFYSPLPPLAKTPYISNLWLLLRTNTGFINWSSTSPFGGFDEDGEYSVILPEHGGFQLNGEIHGIPFGVFDRAFSSYAFKETSKDKISISEFFSNLSKTQHDAFQEAKNEDPRKVLKSEYFANQDSQTLFDFKGRGYAVDKTDNDSIDNGQNTKH